MTTPIALAVPGLGCESQVIAGAGAHGIDVRRRCVDAADLLGACLSSPGLTAVITAGLPRLSADAVMRLHSAHSKVVAIAVRPEDRVTLESFGIDVIIECGEQPAELIARIASALQADEVTRGVWDLELVSAETSRDTSKGRLIAVWGPPGAPGRSTTALVLAQCLSVHSRTVVIDADTLAPSLALQLGIVDDLSGVILACRHAEIGGLTSRSLDAALSKITDNYFALTGLAHARRAPELRSLAFARVLDRIRSDFSYAVVDIGSQFEPASAATTLAAADVVVAVCRAEPLGVARLLSDLPDLAEHGVPIVCVISGGSQGDQAQQLIREATRGLGLAVPIVDLSLDPNALAQAIRRGLSARPLRRRAQRGGAVTRLVELVA